jgi:hypothetical protein
MRSQSALLFCAFMLANTTQFESTNTKQGHMPLLPLYQYIIPSLPHTTELDLGEQTLNITGTRLHFMLVRSNGTHPHSFCAGQ